MFAIGDREVSEEIAMLLRLAHPNPYADLEVFLNTLPYHILTDFYKKKFGNVPNHRESVIGRIDDHIKAVRVVYGKSKYREMVQELILALVEYYETQ